MQLAGRGSNGIMRLGVGIGILLLVIWVVSYVVLKITSAAIHRARGGRVHGDERDRLVS